MGKNFLQHVQTIHELQINERGETSYQGQTVKGSRFFDLVHDFMRNTPSKSPAKGWQVFAKALKDSNIYRELIENHSRWQYMQTLEEPEEFFDTSEEQPSTSTPQRPTIQNTLERLAALRQNYWALKAELVEHLSV